MPVDFARYNKVSKADVDELNGVALADIEGISGHPAASPLALHWTFNGQAVNTSTSGAGWSPTGDMSGWASGTDCTSAVNNRWVQNQTQQQSGLSTTKEATGWRIDSNATGSGGTGPTGAHAGFDGGSLGGHSTASGTRYAYAEATGSLDTNNHYIMRSPGIVFKNEMASGTNDLDLKFYAHMWGSRPGILKVYIDDAASSASDEATLLSTSDGSYSSTSPATVTVTNTAGGNHTSITPSSATWTGNSSAWVEFVVSLNNYRNSQDTLYIYFVYEADNFFTSDWAIDDIRIIES